MAADSRLRGGKLNCGLREAAVARGALEGDQGTRGRYRRVRPAIAHGVAHVFSLHGTDRPRAGPGLRRDRRPEPFRAAECRLRGGRLQATTFAVTESRCAPCSSLPAILVGVADGVGHELVDRQVDVEGYLRSQAVLQAEGVDPGGSERNLSMAVGDQELESVLGNGVGRSPQGPAVPRRAHVVDVCRRLVWRYVRSTMTRLCPRQCGYPPHRIAVPYGTGQATVRACGFMTGALPWVIYCRLAPKAPTIPACSKTPAAST